MQARCSWDRRRGTKEGYERGRMPSGSESRLTGMWYESRPLRLVEQTPRCTCCWRELSVETLAMIKGLPFCADRDDCAAEFAHWDGQWDDHPVLQAAA